MQIKHKFKELTAHKGVKNFLWISADKVFKLLSALVIGVWTARYLGPLLLGKLNYVLAYISIITAVSTLGVEGFLVKEILMYQSKKNNILGTAFFLRVCVSLLSILIVAIIVYFQRLDEQSRILYYLLCVPVLLSPLDLIDIDFQSKLNSKFTVVAKNIGYVFGTALKIYLLVSGRNLVFFAAVYIVEALVSYTLLVRIYQRENNIRLWKFDKSLIHDILRKSWPFMLASLSVILYMRLDQIMIGNFLGDKSVGEFSAAVKITEIILFLPMAISSSYLPGLIESKKSSEADFINSLKRLLKISLIVSLSAAVFLSVFAKYIVWILYGQEFIHTKNILMVYSWTLIPVFLGVATNQYLVVENLQKFSFYRTVIGLATNLLLNFLLIPKYGTIGAAFATVISYYISAIFSNVLFKETRILFKLQFKSVFN